MAAMVFCAVRIRKKGGGQDLQAPEGAVDRSWSQVQAVHDIDQQDRKQRRREEAQGWRDRQAGHLLAERRPLDSTQAAGCRDARAAQASDERMGRAARKTAV